MPAKPLNIYVMQEEGSASWIVAVGFGGPQPETLHKGTIAPLESFDSPIVADVMMAWLQRQVPNNLQARLTAAQLNTLLNVLRGGRFQDDGITCTQIDPKGAQISIVPFPEVATV